MAEVRKAIEQVTRLWQELSGKQRLLLVGGGVLTVVVLLLFIRQLATPSYKVLLNGLTPDDAQSVASQLATRNIPHQLDSSGTTISVPAEHLDAARLEVASQGMPHSGRLGFEIFDKVSWGQTEFDEKVNYQRALEGELERTIRELRDVEAARVHLVLPADSVFIDRQRTAKASVILKLKRGSLSGEAQMSIARLVAGAVDSLSPENVAVVDADTNRPLGLSRGDATGMSLDEQLTRRLSATLAPVLGPEHVRASVNVEFDPSTTDESEERYDPASAVTLSMQRSEERIGGATAGGIAGTSSNVPGAKVASNSGAAGEDGNQNTKSEVATYGVNKTVRHFLRPAGRIRRITAALLIDDAVVTKQADGRTTTEHKKWSSEELKQVRELAEATLGLDAARGDLVSVQNISFEPPAPQSIPPVPRLERIRTFLSDWSSALRYVVMILLFVATYALVIRPIKRQAITTMKELPARSQRTAAVAGLDGMPHAIASEALLAVGESSQKTKLLKKQVLDRVNHEPQSSSRLVQAWLHEE